MIPSIIQLRRSFGILAASAVLLAGAGCASPIVLDTLRGRAKVYPDLLDGNPTVMAFLSANDRRCDKEIPSLLALHYRDGTPVQIVGVVVYDDYSFVNQITTLDRALFTVLLDPDRRLVQRMGIREYPTYLFLNPQGREVDRVNDIRLVRRWVDSPRWHRKALGGTREAIWASEDLGALRDEY